MISRYRVKVLPSKQNRSDRYTLDLLDAEFGSTRLISLQSKDIADFRDARLGVGRAPATVVKDLNLLRVLVDYAIQDMGIYLPSNPARSVKNPSVKNSRDRVFMQDEERILFSAFTHPMLPAIATLAIETACRLGELLNMEWKDIDLAKRTVFLPKTKIGESRTIPLSSVAIKTLHKIPRAFEGGRAFGCWARVDSFEKVFKRALIRARTSYEKECALEGTNPHPTMLNNLRFHDLRHIATSRLAKRFPNVIELSRITGHKDLKSLSRYYHVSIEDLALRMA